MAVEQIDGYILYSVFKAGAKAVFHQSENLNRINVFPVADGDTGTNLSLTLKSIMDGTKCNASIKETLASIADSAFMNAQGNVGIIFAQYLLGLNLEMPDCKSIGTKGLALIAQNAVKHVYNAMLNPVEGTILTVIKDWADSLVRNSLQTDDFIELANQALLDAQTSLANTPLLLPVLAENGVLDSGAQGFVYFLEGVRDFVSNGCIESDIEKGALPQILCLISPLPIKKRNCRNTGIVRSVF